MPTPSLIVFDLGNVLVRIARGWAHAFELAGISDFTFPADPATLKSIHELVVATETGQLTSDQFCSRVSTLLNYPAPNIRRALDAYNIAPFPGSEQLLLDLRDAHIPTACLSNTQDAHWSVLLQPPFPLHLLTHRFASQELRLRKPDPAIYRELERRTGFSPDQILFFDDLPENIAAATAAGWAAELVPVQPDPIPFLRSRLTAHGIPL